MKFKKLFFLLFVFCFFPCIALADDISILNCVYKAAPITVEVPNFEGSNLLDSSSIKTDKKNFDIDNKYYINFKSYFVNEYGGRIKNKVAVMKTDTEKRRWFSDEFLLNYEKPVSNKNKTITINAIHDYIIHNYKCSQYVYVKDDGDDIIASNDLNNLYLYGSSNGKINEDFYILTLENQERNDTDVCFYNTSADVLNEGNVKTSVYFFLNDSKNRYMTIKNGHTSVQDLGEKKYETCPNGFYKDGDSSKPFDNSDGINPNLIINKFGIKPSSGEFVNTDLSAIKNELINNTKTLNEGTNDFKSMCTKSELSQETYRNCLDRYNGKIGPYEKVYKDSSKLIENAINSGLSEESPEIQNFKKAVADYADIKKVEFGKKIQRFYCEYQSNIDDKYMVISRNCTSDITSCSFDFTVYSDKTMSNVVDKFSSGELKKSISDTCMLLTATNLFDSISESTRCYTKINFDVVDNKISFFTPNMLNSIKSNQEWKYSFNLTGVRKSFDDRHNFSTSEVVSDFTEYKLENDGYAIKTGDACAQSGYLIYDDTPLSCSDFFDSEMVGFLQTAYFYIEVFAGLAIIGLSIKDYAVSILNSNQDELKKSNSRLVTRILILVVILLLPVLIKTVLRIFNISSFNSNDPLCGIVEASRNKSNN